MSEDYSPPERLVHLGANAVSADPDDDLLVDVALALAPVLADLRARVCGLPVLTRLVDHEPDCPGRPGRHGICTCDRQMAEMVSVDAVLALIDGGGSDG